MDFVLFVVKKNLHLGEVPNFLRLNTQACLVENGAATALHLLSTTLAIFRLLHAAVGTMFIIIVETLH